MRWPRAIGQMQAALQPPHTGCQFQPPRTLRPLQSPVAPPLRPPPWRRPLHSGFCLIRPCPCHHHLGSCSWPAHPERLQTSRMPQQQQVPLGWGLLRVREAPLGARQPRRSEGLLHPPSRAAYPGLEPGSPLAWHKLAAAQSWHSARQQGCRVSAGPATPTALPLHPAAEALLTAARIRLKPHLQLASPVSCHCSTDKCVLHATKACASCEGLF